MFSHAENAAVSIGMISADRHTPPDGALCLCRWVDASGEFEEYTVARFSAHDGFDSANGRITHWVELYTSDLFVVLSGAGPARLGSHVGYMIGAEGHIDA